MPEPRDHADATRYARSAGEVLVALRDDTTRPAWELGDAGDAVANRHLIQAIRDDHPDDRILSEESADDRRRLSADRVWIIDPLDGTREYTEAGRVDWAVHVALWERGAGLTAGAVALPALDAVLSTEAPPAVPALDGRRLRVVVSRTRAPVVARQVAEVLDADLVTLGSAGAKTMWVVRGEVDAYVHAGGQYEWDSAAPAVVARSAGLHASRLDGSPLEYNQSSPWLPDLVVCRPELAERVLAVTAG
jgi:3'(2'), 5'-bisphosphate nucleotidase